MSTSTGHSALQALQDRHRSSASATVSSCQPSSSRVGVQQLEQQVGAAPGGVLLLVGGHPGRAHRPGALVAPAQAHPHAALAAVARSSPSSSGSANQPVGAASRPVGQSQVGVQRPRVDHPARVQQAVGVPQRLEVAERVDELGAVHALSSSPRAWPSPCSPDSEPPWETTRSAASSTKRRKVARPAAVVWSKSILVCTHPSPKWPYTPAVSPCSVQQDLEPAQVVAEVVGRHRGVLPAAELGALAGHERDRAQTVGAHLPQRPLGGRVGHDHAGGRAAVAARRPPPAARRRGGRLRVSRAHLGQQPGAALRQQVDPGRGRAPGPLAPATSVSSSPSSPAGRGRAGRHVVGGRAEVGWAITTTRPGGGPRQQPHRGAHHTAQVPSVPTSARATWRWSSPSSWSRW
jgi:hypothetical protein